MPTPTDDFELLCLTYLQEIKKVRSHAVASPELSLRTALDNFLNGATAHLNDKAHFINEGEISRAERHFTGYELLAWS